MAFNGNLQDFSPVQILNLIRLTLRTGKLVFTGNYSAEMFFCEGELIYAQASDGEQDLLKILLASGKLYEAQVARIREQAADVEPSWLGVWLLETGYINKSELAQAFYRQVSEVVYGTILYTDGTFSFEEGVLPSLAMPVTAVNLREIIDEAEQLLKDWEHVQQTVPTPDICLYPTEGLASSTERVFLSKIEWSLAIACNGYRSLRQIAQTLNLDPFRARHIAYTLLEMDLVKIVGLAQQPVQPGATAYEPTKLEATLQNLRSLLQQHLIPA